MNSQALLADVSATQDPEDGYDFYVEKDVLRYAGTHLLIDLNGASRLSELETVEDALRRAVSATGATLLDIDLHHFTPQGGISGVAILAESHMSIHTWPETQFAAVDLFLCGRCDAYHAIPILKEVFQPDRVQVTEHKRGLVT